MWLSCLPERFFAKKIYLNGFKFNVVALSIFIIFMQGSKISVLRICDYKTFQVYCFEEALEEKLNELSLRIVQGTVKLQFLLYCKKSLWTFSRCLNFAVQTKNNGIFTGISISCFDQISLCDVQEHSASKKSNVSNNAKEVKHQKQNIVIKGIGKLK